MDKIWNKTCTARIKKIPYLDNNKVESVKMAGTHY